MMGEAAILGGIELSKNSFGLHENTPPLFNIGGFNTFPSILKTSKKY
jgi:hypothetical protein